MLNPSTKALVNAHEFMPGDFTMQPDLQMPSALMHKRLKDAVSDGNLTSVNSSDLALKLFGDAIASNMFIVGVAYQKGLLPLSRDAIFRAIELNGVAIDLNKQAFDKGRQWVVEPDIVEKEAGVDAQAKPIVKTKSLDELIEHRAGILIDYQDQAYSDRYRKMVAQIRTIDQTKGQKLTHAVAKYAFKLMAYKDEYEVARLYSNGAFADGLKRQFAGSDKDYKLTFHMAPPFLSKPDPVTGKIKKREFGPWILPVFKILAKFKGLRGTPLDVFGYAQERKLERSLIDKYQEDISVISSKNDRLNEIAALELLQLPEHIRGFGHVKQKSIDIAEQKRLDLIASLEQKTSSKLNAEPAE
jgi:indolepyruvate ferredoxin oxidoreductase